jgi:NitT/TauT family transport system substrate-binding protein
MFSKLTGIGRFCVILILVAIVAVVGYFVLPKFGIGEPKDVPQAQKSSKPSSGLFSNKSDKYDAAIIVDTYTGWAPIVWGNGGMNGSEESEFYKRFGVKLRILNMDDFEACRATLKNGLPDDKNISNKDAVMAFCTLDSYPVEASSSGDMRDMVYFMIHNFSAGADAIVVRSNINTVADLRGKKIAYSEGTAGHSLLLNTLETSGISGNEVTQVVTGYGNEVAQAFNANQVDAAVVFTPDDELCLKEVRGSKVLISTKEINTLITDGFLAKKSWVEANSEKVKNIIQALLWANSEITHNQAAYDAACRSFSENFDVPLEDVVATGKKINFATLDDNINWFGLNSEYTGVTANSLYTKMCVMYSNVGLTKSPLPWTKVGYARYIDQLSESNNIGNVQIVNGTKMHEFTAPKPELATKPSISDKRVSIEFPVNGYTLDENARTIIDREFLPIVMGFNGIRIRIEGNTDNTGDYNHNMKLSEQRANAVVDYLVRMHGFDRNQFIVVGNGPKQAIADNIKGYNQAYRNTSMQLVQE